MHNLDINFLKDREPVAQESGAQGQIADSQFLIIGGAVAVMALAIVGGSYLFFNSQVDSLKAELSRLTTKETELDGKLKQFAVDEAALKAADARTKVLTNLIVQDIPVSVILQDIRAKTPEGIQVFTITQTGTKITITGQSKGFDGANDFLLILQKSPFLDPTKTKLASARQKPAVKGVNFVLVDYQITAALAEQTTDRLVSDLEKSEAQGAVSRVKLLKEKGVITQ